MHACVRVCVLLACLPTDDTHLNTHTHSCPHDKGTGGPLILFFYSLLHQSPSHDVCVCVCVSTLKYTVCTPLLWHNLMEVLFEIICICDKLAFSITIVVVVLKLYTIGT